MSLEPRWPITSIKPAIIKRNSLLVHFKDNVVLRGNHERSCKQMTAGVGLSSCKCEYNGCVLQLGDGDGNQCSNTQTQRYIVFLKKFKTL